MLQTLSFRRHRENPRESEALNKMGHQRPKIGRIYGHRFGSRRVTKLYEEDGVPMVEFRNFRGGKEQEALCIFNRWAFRLGIPIP